MAIESRNLKFSKAIITKDEDGNFIIEEVKKDESIVTNFSLKLEEYLEIDGLEISITKKSETVSEA